MDQKPVALDPLPVGWLLAPAVIVAAAGAAVALGWDRIPDPMPTHWGFSGQPDAWTEKTPGGVAGMVLIGGLPLALLTPLVGFGVHHQAQHAHEGLPKRGDNEINRARATGNIMVPLVAKFMTAITAIVMGAVVVSLLGLFGGAASTVLLLAGIVVVLVWFVVEIRRGQEGVVKQFGHDDISRNLRWGMFYYNPDDERMLVEHMMGTTLNWANKSAWVLIGVLLLPVIVLVAVAASQ